MTDLVSRLRERHSFLCDEAAEEIARLRELLRDIGGFSTHYVKPEWRNKWAQNLDLIDAALAGAAVQPSVVPRCKRCGDTGWLPGDPILGISEEPCGCDENWEE